MNPSGEGVKYSKAGQQVRLYLEQYVNTVGAVDWQDMNSSFLLSQKKFRPFSGPPENKNKIKNIGEKNVASSK
jgi:hypothetical protein